MNHLFRITPAVLMAALVLTACGEDDSALRADLCAHIQGQAHSQCTCEVDILMDALRGNDKEIMASMLRIRQMGLEGVAARKAILSQYDASEINEFGQTAAAPMQKAAIECHG